MTTITVRGRNGFGPQDGTMTAPGVVAYALCSCDGYGVGELELMRAQITRLGEICGRLMEKVPPQEWLEIAGLQYELEREP